MKTVEGSRKITQVLQSSFDKNVTQAEIKLCSLLAELNLPFLAMDTLIPVRSVVFSDSKIAKNLLFKRTKATKIVESLGNHLKKALLEKIQKPGSFFSLVMDETTDVEMKKVNTKFLAMIDSLSGSATDLHAGLKSLLSDNKIPLENFVGFASDTTNVMVGEHHSVF